MFIGCLPYRTKSLDMHDKMAVLDTEDCTVELIPYKTLVESGVRVYNIDFDSDKYCFINTSSPLRLLKNSSTCYRYGELFIHGESIEVILGGSFIKIYDHKVDVFPRRIYLLYFFKFREYIVIRFAIIRYDLMYLNHTNNSVEYHTVAIKDNTVAAYWDADMQFVKNKELALTIDTLCEV